MVATRDSVIGLALAGLALGLALPDPARAQQAVPEETGDRMQEQVGTLILDRIVIGAGRDKIAIDTPQSVTVVDQEGIDREHPTTVGDVLNDIPGVKAVGSERFMGESFNIRGIGGASAADEPRLIVNVDGATKFYEQYKMGSFFSDPELYKRIEVLRGPASSTLYGSGALAGVINLTTKDPGDFLTEGEPWTVRQKLQYGSNGNEFLTSTIGAARPYDDVELLAAVNYRRMGEYRDGSGATETGTDGSSRSQLAKGRFTFGESGETAITASLQRWHSEQNDQPYSQTGLSSGVFNAFGTVDREVTDTTVATRFEHAPVDVPWLNLAVTATYSNSQNVQSDVAPSLRFAFGDAWTVDYETVQLRVENSTEFGGETWSNFLTYGLQTSSQDRKSDAILSGAPYSVGSHPGGTSDTMGAYVQSEFVYADWLTLIPGVRFDRIVLEADDRVSATVRERRHEFHVYSPKLAVHARLTRNYALFGSVSHTQRAPVLDEMYDTDGQRNLDPEKSNNYEAGFAVSFSELFRTADAFRSKVTFFHNDIDDLIYRAADGQPYFNAEGQTIKGAEVEAGYDAGIVFGSLGYSYIRGELFNGQNLDTVPADEIVLTLGGRVPRENIAFGYKAVKAFSQNLVSNIASTAEGGGKPTSGYLVHNLFASWTPDDGFLDGADFRFGIDNLLDKKYRPHLSGDDARGRTFFVSVTKKF